RHAERHGRFARATFVGLRPSVRDVDDPVARRAAAVELVLDVSLEQLGALGDEGAFHALEDRSHRRTRANGALELAVTAAADERRQRGLAELGYALLERRAAGPHLIGTPR